MAYVKRKGVRGKKYSMRDRDCIARECFSPGEYQSRGATMSGSRNTGNVSLTCMHRAYHGCPYDGSDVVKPQPELAKKRKADGWKNA